MHLKIIITFAVLGLCLSVYSQSNDWISTTINDMSKTNSKTELPFYKFIDKDSFSILLYELKAGQVDKQNPHKLDEIYYVSKGIAEIEVEDEMFSIQTGDVIFVKAEAKHRFINIKENLQTIVVFSKSNSNTETPNALVFSLADLRNKSNGNENVWNSFLNVSSMMMGLY